MTENLAKKFDWITRQSLENVDDRSLVLTPVPRSSSIQIIEGESWILFKLVVGFINTRNEWTFVSTNTLDGGTILCLVQTGAKTSAEIAAAVQWENAHCSARSRHIGNI